MLRYACAGLCWVGVARRYVLDFEETGQLGHGSFCNVFRCVRRMDGCEYAMKISKHSVVGRMAKKRQRQEVMALAALVDCPFIVRYFSAWEEEGKQYVQVRGCAAAYTQHRHERRGLGEEARQHLKAPAVLGAATAAAAAVL